MKMIIKSVGRIGLLDFIIYKDIRLTLPFIALHNGMGKMAILSEFSFISYHLFVLSLTVIAEHIEKHSDGIFITPVHLTKIIVMLREWIIQNHYKFNKSSF